MPGAKYMQCALRRKLPACRLQKQTNKYVQYSFNIPKPGHFLDICNYVVYWVFPFGPSGSQQPPFFPTHWQPLDLESTTVIVIYVLSHDRSAHIILSIGPRWLKVTTRLGFNHCILSPQKSEAVTAHSRWFRRITRGCYFMLSQAESRV